MRKEYLSYIFPAFFILFFLFSPVISAEDAAVVVSNENPVNNLSLRELVKIFKNEKQHWPDGETISIVVQEADAPQKKALLKNIYKMQSDDELKRFWLGEIFQGRASAMPKTFSSDEAIRTFVSMRPGAIGFVAASSVDATVKALSIDGAKPGETDYPLSQ